MKIRIVFLLALLFIFSSCDSDDISPAVSLTASSSEISEDQGLTTITATLNSETNQEIIMPLTFSGTAIFGEDYISSESSLIIPSGESSGSLSISSMQELSPPLLFSFRRKRLGFAANTEYLPTCLTNCIQHTGLYVAS